jgi:hypothetical protein
MAREGGENERTVAGCVTSGTMVRDGIEALLSESHTVMLVLVKSKFGEGEDDDDDDGRRSSCLRVTPSRRTGSWPVIEGGDMKMMKELSIVTEASGVDWATWITLDDTPSAPAEPFSDKCMSGRKNRWMGGMAGWSLLSCGFTRRGTTSNDFGMCTPYNIGKGIKR